MLGVLCERPETQLGHILGGRCKQHNQQCCGQGDALFVFVVF